MSARAGPTWRVVLAGLRRLAAGDDGQAMTEYAITSFALIAGAGVSLLVFLPNTIAAYKIYINGFYIILGLPFP